jgi:hypothetical protein
MKKSEEILEKHIVLNDCIGYLGSDGRLYKAIIDALNEAINNTHCCTGEAEQLMQSCTVCGMHKHPVLGAHCKASNCPNEH